MIEWFEREYYIKSAESISDNLFWIIYFENNKKKGFMYPKD